MARRDEDNEQTKSGQIRRRGQYRIQYVMMMNTDLLYLLTVFCDPKINFSYYVANNSLLL